MDYRLNTVTAVLIAILLLWGVKIAPWGQFHTDYLSAGSMRFLRGLAAVGVILHHISQEEAMKAAGLLGLFENAGFFFVALFFFCSGYGLMKNLRDRPGYLDGFCRRRLPVILVPYYLSAWVYLLFRLFVLREELPAAEIITGALGLVMINEYAWYPVVLALLYLVFWAVFRRVKKRRTGMALMLLFILLMGAGFCVNGHFAWWADKGTWWLKPLRVHLAAWWMKEKVLLFSGEWWVNSAIALFVGMVFANGEEKITPWLQRHYWLKLVMMGGLFLEAHRLSKYAQARWGYWSEYSGHGPHIGDKFICYFAQQPEVIFFVLLAVMLTLVLRTDNPVLRFFNKLSLETYLMNLMALQLCRGLLYDEFGRVIANGRNRTLFTVAVFALTIALALPFKWLSGKLIRLIGGKKKA